MTTRAERLASELDSLLSRGFDNTRVYPNSLAPRCSQCEALVINGIAAHEPSCPNAVHECRGCNALLPATCALSRFGCPSSAGPPLLQRSSGGLGRIPHFPSHAPANLVVLGEPALGYSRSAITVPETSSLKVAFKFSFAMDD